MYSPVPLSPSKLALATLMQWKPIHILNRFLFQRIFGNNYIRAINYHATPTSQLAAFRQQLEYYRKHFSSVNLEELRSFLATGIWKKDKPGLIISFDDGLASNYPTMELLDAYGFTGWYFIPTDWVDVPVQEQKNYAKRNKIFCDSAGPGGRLAMTWDEIGHISDNHVIGSHTCSHLRMTKDLDFSVMEHEICKSKLRLEQKLDKIIEIFSWVGWEEQSYHPQASKLIKSCHYTYAFIATSHPIKAMCNPFGLYRTNIETNWPSKVVKFQLWGGMDVYNDRKRIRVDRVISGVCE